MPHRLRVQAFSESCLPAVQSLSCGPLDYQVAVAAWIKLPLSDTDGALANMAKRGTRVWLYFSSADELIGYGSLGTTNWSFPYPNGERRRASIIPYVGIDEKFQGKPDIADKHHKYARQIMRHLIFEAVELGFEYLVLKVHDQNHRAIDLYASKFHFRAFRVKEGEYIRMRKRIIAKRTEPNA